jgi:hypothetical protein
MATKIEDSAIGKSSKLLPRKEGYYIFLGSRNSRPGYVEMFYEPVEIIEIENGRNRELVVRIFGRQKYWPINTFQGEWSLIELQEAA